MLILTPVVSQAEIFMKKVVRAAQAMRINAVKIACINKAKTSLGIPLPMLTAALQKCYDEHFLPVWGYPVKLYNTTKARPSDWLFIYFDDADAAGAEGYHDLTHRGQPVSKVFVKTSLEDNVPVSVTASHELFEMVIDPIANLWAEATARTQYGYEMCDPVEEDTFMVDGRGTKFDHLGKLKKPFSITKGGYVIVKRNGRVKEKFGSRAKARRFAQEDRRGHRSEFRKPRGLHVRPRKKRPA
jgi:hypothetical protein